MLKSIDVLIGLVVVILALSMAVTVITQAITAMVNSRGKHLKRGLQDLLQQLDPKLTATISDTIASAVLTHPLVSGSEGLTGGLRKAMGGPRYGNVIHREEFTKLLMALASDKSLEDTARQALIEALRNNGVGDPEKTLAAVRTFALDLERASPTLANTARQNLAFLHAGPSDLVAKINSWFDQTMDRTAQRFTASTRAITFAGAFIVAFGLQVDTPSLANRLAIDDKMRDALVQQAEQMNAAETARRAETAKADAPPVAPDEQASAPGAEKKPVLPAPTPAPSPTFDGQYRALLDKYGIIHLPSSDGYVEGFKNLTALFGMLVTTLLLSLGAPFWYSVLAQLLQLRSVLAVKDDKQRSERQDTAPPAGSEPAKGTPAVLTGERGDLAAVG